MKKLGVIDPSVKLSPRHSKVPAWKDEKNRAWQERRMEVYAAQVTIMDRAIGQVIKHLKSTGQLENTLILFTIDNGGCHVEYGPDRKGDYLPEKTRDGKKMKPGNLTNIMPGPEITYQSYGYGWANLSNTPHRLFKQYDHEGGIHTPMIAHWPKGIKGKGTTSNTLSHLVDLMPTILEATGIKPAEKSGGRKRIAWDGRSILPSLQGKKQTEPAILFFNHARGKAVRVGQWKLVFNKDEKKNAKWELYNLNNDPNELKDLAKTLPNKVEELSKLWHIREKNQLERAKL
jgi:arylsulfatase A-like enzyme